MCGRYSLFSDEDNREIMKIVQQVSQRHPDALVKTGEIYPTNPAPILIREGEKISADLSFWGFPHFKGSGVIINARAETAAQRPLFRDSLAQRRCAVPTTGFYEWSKDQTHQKYRFFLPEENVLYLGGIYKIIKGQPRFVIMTAAGNDSIRDIHARMPVIIRRADIDGWITDSKKAFELLQRPFPALSRELA